MGYRDNFRNDKRGNHGWYTCAGCGKKMRFDETTVDHCWPQHYGGWDSPDNLQPMCRPCNSRKSDHMVRTVPDYVRNNAERTINKIFSLFK